MSYGLTATQPRLCRDKPKTRRLDMNSGICLRSLTLLLALTGLATNPAAQDARSEFKSCALRHVAAGEVAMRLRELLAGAAGSEVFRDFTPFDLQRLRVT